MKTDTGIIKNREQALWELIDEARGKASMRFIPLVRYLRQCGEQLSVSELMYLQQRTPTFDGSFGVPPSVAHFFLCLIDHWQARSILDPFGGLGILGAWLADNLPDTRVDIASPYPDSRELVTPLNLENLSLHFGSPSDVAGTLPGQYDAIFSIPPINGRIEKRVYSVSGGQVELADDPAHLLLADSAALLGRAGFLAFVVAPRFAWETKPRSVRRNLDRFGLHLSALLTFPPGTFPGTSLALDLAIIDGKQRQTLFVAEVPHDIEAQRELIQGLRQRKQGPTSGQGRLIPEEQFHGLAALEARERYGKLAKSKGVESVPFQRAVPAIEAPMRRGSSFARCEEHPHAVYLPVMASTNATTRQDELPPRLKSYFQLLVDPEIVLPEYLAGMLNTPMGHALRQSVMTGASIPRIQRPLLTESKLYLPHVDKQRLTLQATHEIQRLRSELAELESRVWDEPSQPSNVIEALGRVNHEERLSDWVETLPFPLASILRSYHALDRTPKEKYERLLHFFEAFTIFCAAIHISAFRTSVAHWQPQKDAIQQLLDQQLISLEKASFGSWRAIAELMASRLRSMLRDKKERAVARELYLTADIAPIEMLALPELAGLLQRVNNFRNRWRGHGGAATQAEAAERHALLKTDLDKTREILGTKFLQYQLIEPREAEILDGPVFRCQIRRVMGSNPLLEHDRVDLITPAKTGGLYLHNPGHDKALELVPLVQVRDTPQPAAYFYNHLEGVQPHWVSYQLAAQSEIASGSTALLELLGEFTVKDERGEEMKA